MTDGAARTLLGSGNQALIDRAVPHLITRNREEFWTSGQWMTEIPALRRGLIANYSKGSDSRRSVQEECLQVRKVGLPPLLAQTRNCLAPLWQQVVRLRHHFTNSPDPGRPEAILPAAAALPFSTSNCGDADGRLRNIEINRLKDKLGTRKVPTAD